MNPADPSARSPRVGVPQRPVRPLSISPLLSSLEVSSSRPSLGVQTHIPFCSLTRAVGISPPTSPNPTVPPRPLPPPRPSSFLLTSGRPSTHSRGPNTQRRPRPPLRSLIPRQVLPDLSPKLPSPALRVSPGPGLQSIFIGSGCCSQTLWTGRLEQQVYVLMVLEAGKSRVKATVGSIPDGAPSWPADGHLVTTGEREQAISVSCPVLFL